MERSFGRFVIEQRIGEGGMGVVYSGYDTRLERRVAIKMVREGKGDEADRRLLREARAGAAVSHPNICQVYEIGESEGDLYVVMEFLEGESLAARLQRDPLPVNEALDAVLQVLAALEVIHERGLLHRDIKPSNVFLTAHGAKLLDFGLARPAAWRDAVAETRLTRTGQVMGTPHYMAPEQWRGEAIGPTADLFAAGALLHEALTGKPAFPGATMMEVYEAVLRHAPSPLAGGSAVQGADRIIQRALEKHPRDRYPDARSMAADVRAALSGTPTPGATAARARSLPRFIALPFRILRPDPETDFLAESLPDAVAASLAGLDSLVVRSNRSAQIRAAAEADIRTVARESDVDLIMSGSMLRAGERVRITAELIEAPSGTILWSHTAQVTLGDLFELQDTVSRQILRSLATPLGRRDPTPSGSSPAIAAPPGADVPANAAAYEAYLRGNRFVLSGTRAEPLLQARERYRECLAADAEFAPAWARLARIYRIMAKYDLGGDPAENYRLARQAFHRALELNPELSLAHNYYTYFQVEEGDAVAAMTRLIERAHKASTDPDLFAGLVVACRFCGLFQASLAADRRARRLDPGIRTSVEYTYRLMGDYERAVAADESDPPIMRMEALVAAGRTSEAAAMAEEMAKRMEGHEIVTFDLVLGALRGDQAAARAAAKAMESSSFRDAEGRYTVIPYLALTDPEWALRWLDAVIDDGLAIHPALLTDERLDPLRRFPEFRRILARAEAAHREAMIAFLQAGGDHLLGAGVSE